MRWPVFVGTEPMVDVWSVGQAVSAALRWCDAPDLPDDLTVRDVAARARVLYGADRRPIGQLLTVAGITAARTGRADTGLIRVSGCLSVDRHFHPVDGQLPPTVGVVRQIRVVLHLHDRGAESWIRRPGATRTVEVPDTSTGRLRDDPDLTCRLPDGEVPEPGSLVLLSTAEYLRRHGHRLPAHQWQARGFLVHLEAT
jgi:hypothetical protein